MSSKARIFASLLTPSGTVRADVVEGGGGGGGASFDVVNAAGRIVTSDTDVGSTQSALSGGPIEIADGITLTIDSDGRHLIL